MATLLILQQIYIFVYALAGFDLQTVNRNSLFYNF